MRNNCARGHTEASSPIGCRKQWKPVLSEIHALSDAYKTGEPQAAIKAFLEAKKKR
jgi:hypothetical protein